MQSKLFIDIDPEGNPQIRIEYKHTGEGDDVRDKLIARFISDVMFDSSRGNPSSVILEHGHADGDGTTAFIRLKKD